MSTDLNPAQKAFAKAIQDKVNQTFSSTLGGTCETVNYDPGFNWGMQFGPNAYYNAKSLNNLDLLVAKGTNEILTLPGSTFSNLYNTVLGSVAYGFSEADYHRMQTEDHNADAILQNLVSNTGAWVTEVAPFPNPLPDDIFPPNKLQYVIATLTSKFGKDGVLNIDDIPDALQSVRTQLQDYKVAAAFSFAQRSRSSSAMVQLNAAKKNSKTPSATNGGLETGPSTYGIPFTGIPNQNIINGDLQTKPPTNSVSVNLSFSQFSSTASQLSIGGSAGISVGLDFLSFSIGGSSSYSVSKYASSGFTMTVDVTYPGITIIGTAPTNLATDCKTGWFSGAPAGSILSEVVKNSGKDATGFQYQGSEISIPDTFGPGKAFSRLKTWVICQQPTMKMTFKGGESSKIATDFKQNASASVKLFGLFSIGSVSESYEVQKTDSQSSTGEVTVTMGPPKVIGNTPSQDSTAYVLAGVASYPPSS